MQIIAPKNETRRPVWRTAAIAVAIIGLPVLLAACNKSIEGTLAAYEDDAPAGSLYNRGLGYMNAGNFGDAIKSFDEVDRQHPYTEWARKSLVMSAYASYRRRDYNTAIATANRYLTLYPGNEDAAYAQYIMGQSYFAQVKDVTRDQETTIKAMRAMEEITTRYPESEYAADARKKVIATRDQLAGKEMQVGRYYLERREYVAAINRFDVVVKDYPETRHVEEALQRLVEANLAMGLVREAQTAAAVLGHNFPNSSWYKDAYELLDERGVQPEDFGGEISDSVGNRTS
ncbi:outer membrane protein assembly factor BamD [Bauldia sp.]|uniref:outer membrane protein assembly factor BamD n=1 Tax=Bauldia sp. TaxID=2575872 RepID=UPI003BA925DA